MSEISEDVLTELYMRAQSQRRSDWVENACAILASAGQAEQLRKSVRAVVAMLKNGEYAEHWANAEAPKDADAAALEEVITELVNGSHELIPRRDCVAPTPAAAQTTYSSTQATNCAVCGEQKHTPLRIDWMGGYVCLTCIDKELESRGEQPAAAQDEVPECNGSHDDGQIAAGDAECTACTGGAGRAPVSGAAVDVLAQLSSRLRLMKQDIHKGDTVFRCGFNDAIDSALSEIERIDRDAANGSGGHD